MSEHDTHHEVDLLVIGGGVNGTGIARDAAGRGLKVMLVEQDDLAAHTSSASSKLIHGGLRYLEMYEFRLVREALEEREKLLDIAPHLIRGMRFVMPLAKGMRPAWLIRIGLLLYDNIGGRSRLPKSIGVRLDRTEWGRGLKPVRRGFVYSDGWVDDARLVVLNALDAAERGADIRTHVKFEGATREADHWACRLGDGSIVRARAIANTSGPWVGHVLGDMPEAQHERPPRLVKGSHIVVPQLFAGDHAFILQNADKRVIFAIPYQGDLTLVGTTDKPFDGDPSAPTIDPDETEYLCASVNRYFTRQTAPDDVVTSYSGVRPLFDDGNANASEVTRDYVLKLGTRESPQILSAFGGKITTYRRLSEHALDELAPFLPPMGPQWTADAPLPGGDVPPGGIAAFADTVARRWPFLGDATALRMTHAYGTRIGDVMGDATSIEDLGDGLSTREVDYLVAKEWARSVDDILWRRTKLGIHGGETLRDAVAAYLKRSGIVTV
ncbi:glycerol-3-phosphate dehydrogenase [Sphingomonas sp. Leaf38]|uniref:glycerol-3-phosphate dehydrogenase n=1 Tax=Sphingomonas sp. Leaf38 TaxID=1736217 RepID=UPI0006F3769D|nr:glycerol-3-phosphate dehydrogenase [Sphingomonas sp. Leaf38]KQN32750.1 glycerol-3-phosphate dehydrogenase [Sphingomonas sp. Leaf38]